MADSTLMPPGCRPQLPTLDRRAAVRYHCERDITCGPIPEGDEGWSAQIQDISTTGIGLLVDRYIEPETYLAVEMPAEDPIMSYTFLVRVVRARAKGEEQWLLGCVFARELSDEELAELL
jgi:hypothetical protein